MRFYKFNEDKLKITVLLKCDIYKILSIREDEFKVSGLAFTTIMQ